MRERFTILSASKLVLLKIEIFPDPLSSFPFTARIRISTPWQSFPYSGPGRYNIPHKLTNRIVLPGIIHRG